MPAPRSIRIVRGDARELPGVPAQSVALVVTSPPYPMLPRWDGTFAELGAHDFDAMHQILDGAWDACHRALISGGILAVNVGDALRTTDGEFQLWPNHARVLAGCEALGFRPLPYILWKKPTNKPNAFLGSGFVPPNAYVTLDCEFVLLFRKGRLRRLVPHAPERAASRYTKSERDRWFTQVWEGIRGVRQTVNGARTGAFPPEIPNRLIRMFSLVGDTVLDPFAGTGTTLWEAARLGRDAVGVERDSTLAARLERLQDRWARGLRVGADG